MSQKISITEGVYKSFLENEPGELDGKEGFLVRLNANGRIELATSGSPIGILVGRLQPDNPAWNVRLLGTGTARVVQDTNIVPGALVQPSSGAKVINAGSNQYAIGVKLAPATSGNVGDVIEILVGYVGQIYVSG